MTLPYQPVHQIVIALVASCALLLSTLSHGAAIQATELLSDNIDVDIKIYPAEGDYILLWIAPDYGFKQGQHELAENLVNEKIETWMVDITESLFLSRGSRSMRQMTGKYVAELLARAHQKTTKKIILVSSFYGAIPVLRGARQWQLDHNEASYLLGAVLFSPALYAEIPTLGKDPEYLPIANATNLPVMIFQGETNGFRWQVKQLLQHLYASGSPAYSSIMPGISSLFYPDKRNSAMEAYFSLLPNRIRQTIALFEQSVYPSQAIDIKKSPLKSRNLDIELRAYKGNVVTSPIHLVDVTNKKFNLNDFSGKVTVLNFWATWCPPCVEEIPSLNKLAQTIDHPDFRVISVNYAESADVIKKFLKTFKVEFPVLLDHKGEVSRDWKIVVFPSTFIIGIDGNIKYGVNAAIQWDAAKTVEQIKGLLPK